MTKKTKDIRTPQTAVGRASQTTRPLRILVHADLQNGDWIQQLDARGNDIEISQGLLEGYDLVIGPNCWRVLPALLDYLPIAIKAARSHRYGGIDGRERTTTTQ